MTLIDLDAGSAAILSWLLTYAIHSTILLGVALIIALRLADEHAWLDLVWKAALLGPLVTASVQVGSGLIPLGGRWPIGIAAPVPAPHGRRAGRATWATHRRSAARTCVGPSVVTGTAPRRARRAAGVAAWHQQRCVGSAVTDVALRCRSVMADDRRGHAGPVLGACAPTASGPRVGASRLLR